MADIVVTIAPPPAIEVTVAPVATRTVAFAIGVKGQDGASGQSFDQSLNTTDSPQFQSIKQSNDGQHWEIGSDGHAVFLGTCSFGAGTDAGATTINQDSSVTLASGGAVFHPDGSASIGSNVSVDANGNTQIHGLNVTNGNTFTDLGNTTYGPATIDGDGNAVLSKLTLPDLGTTVLECKGASSFGYNGGPNGYFNIDESGNISQQAYCSSSFAGGLASIDSYGNGNFQGLNVSGATIDSSGNLSVNLVNQFSNTFSLNYDGSASFSSGKTSILSGDVGGAEFNGSNQAFVGINNTGDVDFGQINLSGVSVNGYLKTETNNAGDKFGLHIHSSGYLSLDGNNFSINENGNISAAGSASFIGDVNAQNIGTAASHAASDFDAAGSATTALNTATARAVAFSLALS